MKEIPELDSSSSRGRTITHLLTIIRLSLPNSVAAGPHFEEFIKEQLEIGCFDNASEVMRAGRHLLEGKRQALKLAALRAAIRAGIVGSSGAAAEPVFDRLEKGCAAMGKGSSG